MVLVDTSVWVNHLRHNDERLSSLLNNGEVICHPFVIGELALGSLSNRTKILSLLKALPCAPVLDDEEILYLISSERLMSKGIGLVDVHLLASARLATAPLWTLDVNLAKAARNLGVSYKQ